MTIWDFGMLISAVFVIVVPWLVLRNAASRPRVRWMSLMTSVVFAASIGMMVIPYQLHALRRDVILAAIVILGVGGMLVVHDVRRDDLPPKE